MSTAAVNMITLQSSDKENFEVDEKVVTESLTIKHMIEDGCAKSTIPVPNVTGKILAMVIEYCKKHAESSNEDKEKKNPSSSSDAADDSLKKPVEESEEDKEKNPSSSSSSAAVAADSLKTWDAEFVKVGSSTLFDLILAANYLDIKSLLDLTSQAVADMIVKAKTPDRIRKTLNIQSDFTPEEEDEHRKENPWAFE